jgi:hypothetical protein
VGIAFSRVTIGAKDATTKGMTPIYPLKKLTNDLKSFVWEFENGIGGCSVPLWASVATVTPPIVGRLPQETEFNCPQNGRLVDLTDQNSSVRHAD